MTPFLERTNFNMPALTCLNSIKVEDITCFRPGKLYSLCSQGNQDYQKIIHFFFVKKVEFDKLHYAKVVFVLELVVIINES